MTRVFLFSQGEYSHLHEKNPLIIIHLISKREKLQNYFTMTPTFKVQELRWSLDGMSHYIPIHTAL